MFDFPKWLIPLWLGIYVVAPALAVGVLLGWLFF